MCFSFNKYLKHNNDPVDPWFIKTIDFVKMLTKCKDVLNNDF